MIRIIAVGKKHESWVAAGISRYESRLRKPYGVEWVLLPHSSRSEQEARQEESERILSRIADDEYVVLMDERGELLDSPAFSAKLANLFVNGKKPVFVIGGAYGVSEVVQQRANLVWSLSPLVLPHQMVRLVLAEQLYRSQEIQTGRPYHHV